MRVPHASPRAKHLLVSAAHHRARHPPVPPARDAAAPGTPVRVSLSPGRAVPTGEGAAGAAAHRDRAPRLMDIASGGARAVAENSVGTGGL